MEISYKDIREHVHNGDIVFVKGREGWISSVVRFFTHSEYSHVGFAFWIMVGTEARLMMVEAQGGTERRIVNMSFYKDDELDIIKRPIEWNTIANDVISSLGVVKYGWLDAIYVGVREFLMKNTNNIVLPLLNLPGEICSEFVATVLDLPEKHISPQLLYEQLLGLGHEVRAKVRSIRL